MKKHLTLLFLLSISVTFSQIKSDKITPPAEGKSVIYFMRTTSLGALMNVRYFKNNEYLGKFKGVNYLRYECDPGENIFWIKAENIDVLKANLEANKIYIVETNAVMGAFSAGVKFNLVDFNKKKQINRINKLFDKKSSKTFTEIELKEGKAKMMSVVQKGMKKVSKKIKSGKIKVLESNMNYTIQE